MSTDLELALAREGRLARVEEKVDAINGKLDDAIISQLRDHGKRIAALERARAYSTGWVACAGAVAGGLASLAARML